MNHTNRGFNVVIHSGDTPTVRAYLYENGRQYDPPDTYTAQFGYGTDFEDSTSLVLVDGVVGAETPENYFDFAFTAPDTATPGDYYCQVIIKNSADTGRWVFGDGKISILKSPISGSPSPLNMLETVNWDTIESTGTVPWSGSATTAVWGGITGTLSDQTDLQSALDLKEDANANIQAHIANVTTNPHEVDKGDVGLGNVDNTSDLSKPISTLTQAALDLKADTSDLAAYLTIVDAAATYATLTNLSDHTTDATIHFTESSINHSNVSGLAYDDSGHTGFLSSSNAASQYLLLDASNGPVTGNLTVNATITGNTLTVGTASPSSGFNGVGDIYATKNFKVMEGAFSEAAPYGTGLEVSDNALVTTYTNIPNNDATLTAATQTITDSHASFDSSYVGQFLRIASSTPSYAGAVGEIISVADGTHLTVSFGTAGGASIVDATAASFVIYPAPRCFVGDNGDIHFNVGVDKDASFKVSSLAGANDHSIHAVVIAGVDGHCGMDMEMDAHTFGGVSGYCLKYDATAFSDGTDGIGFNVIVGNTGATGGDFHSIDVAQGDPTDTTLEVVGLGTHTGVDVIHQHIGVQHSASIAFLYDKSAGTYTDVTTACSGAGADVQMFLEYEDELLIGYTSIFDQLNILLTTAGDASIKPKYYYTEAASATWTEFSASDDTTGLKWDGSIRWDPASFTSPAWGERTINEVTGSGAATDYYWVKVRRTKPILPNPPTPDTIKLTKSDTFYDWDNEGNLSIKSITDGTATLTGGTLVATIVRATTGVYDNAGTPEICIDTTERRLTDTSGSVVMDWSDANGVQFLTGLATVAGPTLSVDVNSRQLIADDGGDIILDWSASGAADFSNSTITTTNTIEGGTLTDGTATLTGGALTALGTLGMTTIANITDIVDEDAMGSDSAQNLCTQQSIKKYVDDNVNAQTPWTANIEGAGYDLNNVGDINSKSDEGDFIIKNLDQDNDMLLQVNDGGTVRTAIQVHGDQGNISFPRQSRVTAYRSSSQTIAHNTFTILVFNVETEDTLGEYNTTTGVFTAKDAGIYQFNAKVLWSAVNNNVRYDMKIYVNGSAGKNTVAHQGAAAAFFTESVSQAVTLTAGQTLDVRVWQLSGGNESIYSDSAGYTSLSIVKVA